MARPIYVSEHSVWLIRNQVGYEQSMVSCRSSVHWNAGSWFCIASCFSERALWFASFRLALGSSIGCPGNHGITVAPPFLVVACCTLLRWAVSSMCFWVLIPAKKRHIRIEASVVYSTRTSSCDYTNVKNYIYRESD